MSKNGTIDLTTSSINLKIYSHISREKSEMALRYFEISPSSKPLRAVERSDSTLSLRHCEFLQLHARLLKTVNIVDMISSRTLYLHLGWLSFHSANWLALNLLSIMFQLKIPITPCNRTECNQQ